MDLTNDGLKMLVVLGNQTQKIFPLKELLDGNMPADSNKKKVEIEGMINYGAVHSNQTFTFALANDNQSLYTISTSGALKRLSQNEKKLLKDYGVVSKSPVSGLKLFE